MSAFANPQNESAVAARELAELRRRVQQARAELADVRADIVAADAHLDGHAAARLLAANEQLVQSALRARTDADTAAQALKEASHSAEFDPLTALPNRVLLRDRLAQAISTAKRHGTRSALLFMDLNNFKLINDTMGHAMGDEVLKLAAGRLATSVRATDTVSRHGGDEFVILLAEVGTASDAVAIADKLGAALCAPCMLRDQVIRLTASIGISLYPDDGEEADLLIDRADAAMYRAKRQGLRNFVFRRDDDPAVAGSLAADLPALRQPVALHRRAIVERGYRDTYLQEANENLVLAALTAQELQAAAQQAQVRQRELLAVVAHELRSPLAPIRTAAALLTKARADEPLLRRVQAVIERQVAHIARLVDDLLDVSRANAGKLRLDRRTVDLSALIDEAVACCRPAMDTRLQHLHVFVPSRVLEVEGDPIRLTQVLCNLLDNASKYTQVGGEVGLAVDDDDEALVIAVSDNGIGIAAEAMPHVFDPFVQDRHAIGFGLGLGLTVVRELVEAHGGNVVASSAGCGLGSKFVLTLPKLVR